MSDLIVISLIRSNCFYFFSMHSLHTWVDRGSIWYMCKRGNFCTTFPTSFSDECSGETKFGKLHHCLTIIFFNKFYDYIFQMLATKHQCVYGGSIDFWFHWGGCLFFLIYGICILNKWCHQLKSKQTYLWNLSFSLRKQHKDSLTNWIIIHIYMSSFRHPDIVYNLWLFFRDWPHQSYSKRWKTGLDSRLHWEDFVFILTFS